MKNGPLRFFIYTLLNVAFSNCYAQAGDWVWMQGSNQESAVSQAVAQGVPSPANEPSSRYAPGFWTDTAGTFWVYGGWNGGSDLWNFNPYTLEWTWMQGSLTPTAQYGWVPSPKVIDAPLGVYDGLNSPGGLGFGMFTWVTSDDHLWLYGGSITSGGVTPLSADLWQYDLAINQWAWMGTFGSGYYLEPVYGTMGVGTAATMPGARNEGNSAWTDSSGNLWLFGGFDNDGAAGDMWKYNIATGIWTWMSGSNVALNAGNYGTPGVPSVNNYPPARVTNFFWKDTAGNFWLGGGTNFEGVFQDIWKFNPNTLEWTWVTGPQFEENLNQSGSPCIASSDNLPCPRYENRAVWLYCNDLAMTYAGISYADTNYNDIWGYQMSTNEWIEVTSWGPSGDYGTEGEASDSTYPTVRIGSAGFKDKNNNLWMFGGYAVTSIGFFNDVWEYIPDTSCFGFSCNSCKAATIATGDSVICQGDFTPLTISGLTGININPTTYVTQIDSLLYDLYPDTTTSYKVTGTGCSGYASYNLNVHVLPSIATSISSTICQGQKYLFGADTAQPILTRDTVISWHPQILTSPGTYSDTLKNMNGCDSIINLQLAVLPGDSTLLNAGICPGDFYSFADADLNASGIYTDTLQNMNGCDSVVTLLLHVDSSNGGTVYVSGDSLIANGSGTIKWINCSTGQVVSDSQTLILSRSGSFAAIFTNGSCSDTTGCIEAVVTGMTTVSNDESISIYPNPSAGNWQLTVGNEVIGSLITVYNDEGRLIFQSAIRNPKYEIPASELPSGVYFLRISSPNASITRKLVKL